VPGRYALPTGQDISRLSGFSLWKFLKYIKDEIFTVLGTSSPESVVPQLMRKLEFTGVSKPVVGLVVPSGLTFNPDGQCIHYTMAAIFIAQATDTPLTLTDQLLVLGVLLLTSKGSAVQALYDGDEAASSLEEAALLTQRPKLAT
jgi:aerobic C4-dicarboxylate transport protein